MLPSAAQEGAGEAGESVLVQCGSEVRAAEEDECVGGGDRVGEGRDTEGARVARDEEGHRPPMAEACQQTGGDKASWITHMFQNIERRPYVQSVVWFNVRKEADWPIESSLSAERAFAAGLRRVAQ